MSLRNIILNVRTDRRLNIGFALAIAGLVAIGVFLYQSIEEFSDVVEARSQAKQATYQIKTLVTLLTDAETGQRGYLLTGKEIYLAPYKKATLQISRVTEDLEQLLVKQPDQLERLERSNSLIGEKLGELAATIRLERDHRHADALALVSTDRGQDFMDELRDISKEMDEEQRLQVAIYSERMSHIMGSSTKVVFFGSSLAILIVTLCLYFLDRNQRHRLKSERSLLTSNEALEKQRELLSRVITAQNKIGTAALNSNTIMELVSKYSMELTGADGATIELLEGNSLFIRHTSGIAKTFLGTEIDIDKSLSGACLREGRGLVANDTDTDTRVDREKSRKAMAGSIAVVPLQHGSKTIGVLKNFSVSKDHFDPASFNALTLMTGMLASALAQASEFEEKLSAVINLEKAKFDLIESRDHAQAATLAKSRFLANMSHELRTPLNGVLGMTQLLMDGQLDDKQKEYASAIRSSGQSLLRLVSDILDFSKIEAGRMEFESVNFDLKSTLQDIMTSFNYQARQKSLDLSFEVLNELPAYVKGDPGRVRQILMNLISNALKFTATGAVRVTLENLSVQPEDALFRFKVYDSGIGIPQATVKKLFQEFTQADASTTRRYGGTGLGLSICKRLCEQMNGHIGIESEESRGSVFWFTLRLQTGELTVKQDLVTPLDWEIPTIGRPWRALIAEDNQFNQIIIVKMLEKLGIRADIAGNGKEAVDALQNRPYDVVLMDCQMPEMDGFEATTFIRTSGLVMSSSIPIIAMTANAMKGDQEICLKAGMDDYVSKPIEINQIRDLMMKWLPAHDSSKAS